MCHARLLAALPRNGHFRRNFDCAVRRAEEMSCQRRFLMASEVREIRCSQLTSITRRFPA